jgi:hypothetical protein
MKQRKGINFGRCNGTALCVRDSKGASPQIFVGEAVPNALGTEPLHSPTPKSAIGG